MTQEEFKNLQPGDVVRLKGKSQSFVVRKQRPGGGYIVVREQALTQPDEWDIIHDVKEPWPRTLH